MKLTTEEVAFVVDALHTFKRDRLKDARRLYGRVAVDLHAEAERAGDIAAKLDGRNVEVTDPAPPLLTDDVLDTIGEILTELDRA